MASGDKLNPTQGSFGALLLDAVSGGSANDGAWVDCMEFTSGTVVVTGAATTTVATVNGHNGVFAAATATTPAQLIAPANNVVGGVIATATAGTALHASVPVLPRFIKATITTTGTGTVTAVLMARK